MIRKMLKRVLALALVAAMMCSFMVVTTLAVEQAANVNLVFTDTNGAAMADTIPAGTVVQAKLTPTQEISFTNMELTLSYECDKFELVDQGGYYCETDIKRCTPLDNKVSTNNSNIELCMVTISNSTKYVCAAGSAILLMQFEALEATTLAELSSSLKIEAQNEKNEGLSCYGVTGCRSFFTDGTKDAEIDYTIGYVVCPSLVVTAPTETVYVNDSMADIAGKVTAQYIDAAGNAQNVKVSVSVKGGGNLIAGKETTLVAAYGDYTAEFEVTAAAVEIVDISVTKLPNKMNYKSGETLSLAGLKVTADYNNGPDAEISDYEVYLDDEKLDLENLPVLKVADNGKELKVVSANGETAVVGKIAVSAKEVKIPTVKDADDDFYVFDESEKTVQLDGFDANTMEIVSGDKKTDAGTYTLVIGLKNPRETVWSDGSTDNQNLTWTIKKAKVNKPYLDTTAFEYTGSEQTAEMIGFDSDIMDKSGTESATNVGNYQVTVRLVDTGNYQWSDEKQGDVTLEWSIGKASLTKPTLPASDSALPFNNADQDITSKISGYDSSVMNISGDVTGKDVKNYTVTVSLKDAANYQWVGGETDAVNLSWSIVAKPLADSDFTKIDVTDQEYTGAAIEPAVESAVLTEGTDYEVTYGANTNVGTGTITITGKGNYSGKIEKTFTIKAKALAESDFTVDLTDKNFANEQIRPTVTAAALVEGTDYEVTYGTNTDVGTGTITITGKGNYSGTIEKIFKIVKAPVAGTYTTKVIEVYYENTETQTVTASDFETLPAGITGVSITAKADTLDGDDVVTYTGNTFTLKELTEENVDDAASWKVTVSSNNYQDFEATVQIKVVNKISVKVSGVSVTGAGKIYDGKTVSAAGKPAAVLASDGKTPVNTIDGYTYTYVGTGDTSYNDTQAPKAAGTYKLVVAVEDDEYMGEQEIEFTIKQRNVTIVGLAAAGKTYDGTVAATVTGTAKVYGALTGDTVGVQAGTAAFADKNVGNNKAVTFSGYALEGADAGNYNLTAQPASVRASITAKNVTVSGIVAENRDYNGEKAVTVSGGTVDGMIEGDDVTVVLPTPAVGTMKDANAGAGKAVTVTGVKLGGADAGNYKLTAQPTGVTVDIARIAWDGETSVPKAEVKYGKALELDLTKYLPADAAELTAAVTDGAAYVNGDPAVVGKTLKVTLVDSAANIGQEATVKVSVPASTNYNAYEITVKVEVVDKPGQNNFAFASSAVTKTYGNAAFVMKATGAVSGSTVTYASDNTAVATVDNTGKVTIVGAGTAVITASASETADYKAKDVTCTLTVNKATVTVQARDLYAYLNGEVPSLDGAYNVYGLVGKDQLTTAPTLAYATTPNTAEVGTVAILISGAAIDPAVAGNYNEIVYENGELQIITSTGGMKHRYDVEAESGKGGEISVNGSATEGTTVFVQVDPDKGYELSKLIVTDSKGKKISVEETRTPGKYAFTMPSGDVTVTAVFEQVEEEEEETEVEVSFSDVNGKAYYFDAVEWAVENGVTTGYANGTFLPNNTCTRAQTVTFLWRAMGCPAAEATEMPFTDVDEDAYYYDAVLWALENGITTGVTATTFEPNKTVSRAQTVTFLWRTARISGFDVSVGEDTNILSYEDAQTVPAYAVSALQWACGDGILGGYADGTLRPNAGCTRAHIVTFLYRFLGE